MDVACLKFLVISFNLNYTFILCARYLKVLTSSWEHVTNYYRILRSQNCHWLYNKCFSWESSYKIASLWSLWCFLAFKVRCMFFSDVYEEDWGLIVYCMYFRYYVQSQWTGPVFIVISHQLSVVLRKRANAVYILPVLTSPVEDLRKPTRILFFLQLYKIFPSIVSPLSLVQKKPSLLQLIL